jgi:hypothetical protein
VLVGVERGEDDDLRRTVAPADPLRRREPVDPGHPDVHEHHVGRVLVHERHDLVPVVGLGHDRQVVRTGQHHRQPRTDQGVVIDDQHADGHAGQISPKRTCRRPLLSVLWVDEKNLLDDLAVACRPLADRGRRNGGTADVHIPDVLDIAAVVRAVDDDRIAIV